MSTGEAPTGTDPSARTPLGQGSNIPLGWKPTAAEPVPVVRCVQIKKDGERCKRWSLRGTTKCYKHNGNGGFKNVEERAAAVIEAARLELMETAPEAVDTLKWLMEPGTAEAIRLKAAESVLDRVGIKGGYDIKVDVNDVTESPAETLTKRLAKLAEGAQAVRKLRAESELAPAADAEDIIDAEVVEEQVEAPASAEEQE